MTTFNVTAHMPDGGVTTFDSPFTLAQLQDYLNALQSGVTLPEDTSTAGECQVTYATPGDTTIKWVPVPE